MTITDCRRDRVDGSAIIAIFRQEHDADDYARSIAGDDDPVMSAANLVETSTDTPANSATLRHFPVSSATSLPNSAGWLRRFAKTDHFIVFSNFRASPNNAPICLRSAIATFVNRPCRRAFRFPF